MCQMMSGLITKNKTIYDLDFDSHEELIKKAGMKDTSNSPDFVRVEIVPVDGNIFNHDPKNWQLKVDQDFRPEWFSEKFAESEMRKALKELFDTRFITNTIKEIKEGRWFLSGGTIQNVWGGTIQDVRGGTIQDVSGGTIQDVWGGTIQNVSGGTIQNVRGGTIQNVSGGTIQNVRGGTIQDVRGGTIQDVWGGTIQDVWGNVVVRLTHKDGIIKNLHDNATIKDITSDTPVIYVANKSIKIKVFKNPKG